MMIGIGTPSSQSSIPRPMSASFFDFRFNRVLISGSIAALVNRQAPVTFRRSTPPHQIISSTGPADGRVQKNAGDLARVYGPSGSEVGIGFY
jgi:hypothetical protein